MWPFSSPESSRARSAWSWTGWLACVVSLMGTACGPGQDVLGEDEAPPVALVDLESRTTEPFAATNPVVLLFLKTDCPISNGYAPEIHRLRDKYSALGVGFFLVYPGSDGSAETIRRHQSDHGLEGPAYRDPASKWARYCRVTVTPEAAVFDAAHRSVYHGRIDDRYVAFGVKRPEPTRRDLAEVLDALVAGQPVSVASTKAVGCSISFAP